MAKSFRYVRFTTPQGIGYGLFAIEWDKAEGTLNYKASAAFCNPNDDFLKERARNMATVRLSDEKRRKFTRGELKGLDVCPSISNDDFVKLLPVLLDTIPNAPRWAWKSAKKPENIVFGLTRKTEKLQLSKDAHADTQK